MNRPPALLWLVLLLLLLPTAAGRFLLDLVGGLMLTILALPFLLAGVGWIGWKMLQSKMVSCEACGAASLSSSECCSVCGEPFSERSSDHFPSAQQDISASNITIDVTAHDVSSDSSD